MLSMFLSVGKSALLVVAAAPVALEAEPDVVRVEGFGFTVERFDEAAVAYGNREYVWQHVPEALRGWQFTRLNGGQRASLQASCDRDAEVYLATARAQRGIDLDGWEPVEGWTFCYTDAGRSRMAVYRRRCGAGQTLVIPQGNWTGGMVLAQKIEAAIKVPEPDHSSVPGVIVDYSPAYSGIYVGSPSIAVLPSGDYVASHDQFGPKSTEHERAITRVFRSADQGKTWTHLADIHGQFWSTLFVHRDELYIIGAIAHYSHTIIRRSTDGGRTWTEPKDGQSGLLLEGRYHCAPVPLVVHNGQLWRAMEDTTNPRRWGLPFRAFMMSAPVEADLLDAANWTFTNRLAGDESWLDGKFNGWLEGNAVVTPDGQVLDILRVDTPEGGVAAIVNISDDGRSATFDAETGFIDFPGAAKKFTIRYDAETERYWSLVSMAGPKHRGPRAGSVRNTLALISSSDLRNWRLNCILLYHPDVRKHGFQYPDWQFDGEDIIAAIRTAYDDGVGGAHSAHDANYLTFHRFAGFRQLTLADSVVAPEQIGIE
jgi:hypothetical protein